MKVKDFKQVLHGVPHIKVSGKGGKTRYVPLHPAAGGLIHEYLDVAGHSGEENGALFRSISNNRVAGSQKAITPDAVYKMVREYSEKLGFKIGGTCITGYGCYQCARSSG